MLAVAQKLLNESDRLGLRVIQNWEEERRIKKKLATTREYTFPVLGGGKKKAKADGSLPEAEEDKVDAREVDALLGELSLMSGRWQLLRRFLYGRLKASRRSYLRLFAFLMRCPAGHRRRARNARQRRARSRWQSSADTETRAGDSHLTNVKRHGR